MRRKPERCEWWPDDCPCYRKFNHWADRFLEWKQGDPPDAAELRWAITDCYFMWSCMKACCPDERFRRIARAQLKRPLFVWEASHHGIKLQ
jgi:hypothetical protein